MADFAMVEESLLQAREKTREWKTQYMENYYKPLRNTLVSSFIRGIDPETRAQLEKRVPGALAQVEQQYGGGGNGTS